MRLKQGIPRHFRKPEGAEQPNSGFIAGLMQMYAYCNAWGKVAVEVGSAAGESAEIALHFVGHLYCVDPWHNSKNESLFDQRVGNSVRMTKMKMFSHEAAEQFENKSLDLVYIDGGHNYENVSRDIRCWFPKIEPGGWITGHDYDELERHVDVVRAVDEVFWDLVVSFPDSSWAVQVTSTSLPIFPRG